MNFRATARPMPRAAPVTIATFRSGGAGFKEILPGLQPDVGILLVEGDAGGIAAAGDDRELPFEESAQARHAAVAARKVLLGVQRDRSLAGLRLVVARIFLVLLFGEVPPELARHLRAEAAQLAFFRDAAGDVDAEVGVVDGQHPADGFD